MTGEPNGEPTRESSQFRYASRRIGLFVLLALAVFVAAILQAGVLRGLLNPTANLRVIMPAEGLAGLARGSAVEVLGTRAGEVREIVINPTENFHAIVRIDKAMQPFIRSDSKVLIRKQFGIAGAAFLDITRGTGAELDWDFAVLEATPERGATENIGQIIDQLSTKIFPVIDKTDRVMTALANIAEELDRGEGSAGRLLVDDTLIRDLEAAVAQVPPVIGNADAVLVSLNGVLRNVNRLVPQIRDLAGKAGTASAELPMFITQTRAAVAELERLLVQLQGNWLLGGGGAPNQPERKPLSPLEVRP
jgi:phospholipid/cholesterol/gamma-HCH transport system substrate-binding protein